MRLLTSQRNSPYYLRTSFVQATHEKMLRNQCIRTDFALAPCYVRVLRDLSANSVLSSYILTQILENSGLVNTKLNIK